MRKFIFIIAAGSAIGACQPRHPSDQAHGSASKAVENERARKNAQEDAIQAQRQLDLVAGRTRNNLQAAQPKDAGSPPKK